MSNQRLFGLIGYPLSHSFSSKYFNEKFENEGLDCRYVNFESPELPDLNQLFYENPDLVGLNVTIPYKSDIISSLHEIEEDAQQIGAVNVIHFKDGLMLGYNTDHVAFRKTIEKIDREIKGALILGSGGASKAVGFALGKMGIKYSIISSSGKDGCLSYEDMNDTLLTKNQLIINTTPLGNFPNIETFPPIPYGYLNESHILYDLTYNPPESAFLKKGMEKGSFIKNGYDMLLKQAQLSWEIWNQ